MFVVTRFCGERRARYTRVLLLLLLLALEERKECPIITTRGSGDVLIPKPIYHKRERVERRRFVSITFAFCVKFSLSVRSSAPREKSEKKKTRTRAREIHTT